MTSAPTAAQAVVEIDPLVRLTETICKRRGGLSFRTLPKELRQLRLNDIREAVRAAGVRVVELEAATGP